MLKILKTIGIKKTIKQSVPVRAKNDKVPIKKVPMISFLDV